MRLIGRKRGKNVSDEEREEKEGESHLPGDHSADVQAKTGAPEDGMSS